MDRPEAPSAEVALLECQRKTWNPAPAAPIPYPYPNGDICCAFHDRPFDVMSEDACIQQRAKPLNWPKWELDHGCIAPPNTGPDRPVCCLTAHSNQVTDVTLLPFHLCPHGDNTIPRAWCQLYRCIEGPPAENYPDGSLDIQSSQSDVRSPAGALRSLPALPAPTWQICLPCAQLSWPAAAVFTTFICATSRLTNATIEAHRSLRNSM